MFLRLLGQSVCSFRFRLARGKTLRTPQNQRSEQRVLLPLDSHIALQREP
jgi:hypothetical protein